MQKQVKLKGSGGHIFANITEEQEKKADLGVGELFLAPLGRLDKESILNHYCKNCDKEFESSPAISFETPNEVVAENMVLVERGQYLCNTCNGVIAEYRKFDKQS